MATWLAELLNKPGGDYLHKVDCGKLTSGNELLGMSGAYRGSEQGSALNNFIVKMAAEPEALGVVLLDEIEKAEKSVIHGLYQVLDKGEWTNKRLNESGDQTSTIPCYNVVFIMTTNAADKCIRDFFKDKGMYTYKGERFDSALETLERSIVKTLQQTFPFTDVFINRIGRVVAFSPMCKDSNTTRGCCLLKETETVAKILIERALEAGINVKQNITADTKEKR
jgi:ATP-dependent Clp protease ATP-binding subunit ClpA